MLSEAIEVTTEAGNLEHIFEMSKSREKFFVGNIDQATFTSLKMLKCAEGEGDSIDIVLF